MDKLYAAILEAYEGYHTALDYVKGWKQETTHRKGVVMALINAARKSNPELGAISAKDLFTRTAEMYEAAHTPAEDQEAEVEQAPDEDQEAEVEQAPAEEEATAGEDQESPAEEEATAGEDQEAPADA